MNYLRLGPHVLNDRNLPGSSMIAYTRLLHHDVRVGLAAKAWTRDP